MMDSTAFLPSFLRMLFALAVVLGVLMGAMYFFKRILQQTTSGSNDISAINIIAARYLGPKSSIMLVEVLGKVIVIGLSNNQMSHLATISEPEALDKLKYIEKHGKQDFFLADYLKHSKIAQRIFDRFGKDAPRK